MCNRIFYSHIPDKEWDLQNFWNIFITDTISFIIHLHTFYFAGKHEWRPSNLVFPTSRKMKNSQRPKDFTFLSPFPRLLLRPRHARPLLYLRHRFVLEYIPTQFEYLTFLEILGLSKRWFSWSIYVFWIFFTVLKFF